MKRAALFLLLAAGSTLLTTSCSAPAAPSPLAPGTVAGTVSSREGPLADAFVYVKRGLEGRRFDVPKEPFLLDQHANEFIPRVFGLRAGQPLRIRSSDSGIHNVFCTPFNNPGFNESLMHEQSMTKVFEKPEVMIQFKCNIHGTMAAWVGVLDHPFFAVTGADGAFEIRGLPPGDYTFEAWNEYRGTRQARMTVGAAPLLPLAFRF